MNNTLYAAHECDIVIIGGGLAGLSSALTIAEHSEARVILVDGAIGSNRSLPLTFSDTIQQFGLEDSILERYHGFALRTRNGNYSLHMYDDTPLVSLDYSAASGQLYSRLQAYPTFTQISDRAGKLERIPTGWRICLRNKSTVTCNLLIDASGRAHFSARQLGHPTPPMYSHSYGRIFSDCHAPVGEESVALFFAGNPRHGNGGGWFYPLAGQRASFGFARLTYSAQFPAKECRQGFEFALQEFSPYAEILQDAIPEDVHVGSIPIGPVKRLVYDGLMLVGDAAGQATPWACMGAEPALLNGQLCGRVAVSAFRRQDFSRSRMQDYERMWKTRNGRGYRKSVMLADLEWQRGEAAWEHAVNNNKQLSASEMLHLLQLNTPHISLPLIWWLLVYDRLGLIRRSLRDRLNRLLITKYLK
jgi:digeranylgeranylglycerophospholipid reductase